MKKRGIALLMATMLGDGSTSYAYEKSWSASELEAVKREKKCPPRQKKTNSPRILGNFSPDAFLTPFETPKKPSPSFHDAFWWQLFPLTGLREQTPSYPYLPHAYPLWELAPSLGKKVTVTLIDTGIFGCTFSSKGQNFVQHPDIELEGNFLNEPHSTCPYQTRIADPFDNLVTFVLRYTKESERDRAAVERQLPTWIVEYALYKTSTTLDAYLAAQGDDELFQQSFLRTKKVLSAEGKRVMQALLQGDHGIAHFTLVSLPDGTKAIEQFVPTPSSSVPAKRRGLEDHATHTASIIGARLHPFHTNSHFSREIIRKLLDADTGICGLAPDCTLRVIKALHEAQGTTTDATHTLHALERARQFGTTIVNMSLKLDDTIDPHDPLFKKIEGLLKTFPFVCCAAGNEGTGKPGRIAYPARFNDVPFSVGSFGCVYHPETGTYTYPLSKFSQYEQGKGPSFVAPGEKILGCSCAYPQKEARYAFKTGTSCATAYISGCLALILGEFKNDFSPEQLTAVCRSSCFRLHSTAEWQEHVLYGALDIRTALFTLHVLKNIQSILSKKLFSEQFPQLLIRIQTELTASAIAYGKEQGISHSFRDAFIDYYNATRQVQTPESFKAELDLPLKRAIGSIAGRVLDRHPFPSDP